MSSFSIRYPVTICMILLSFLVLGGISVTKIPLVMLPTINAPFLVVIVPYPNATPEQVQEEITKPLEEALSTIPNVKRIISRSNSDQAVVQMRFGLEQDIDWLRAEVREKVEQVRNELPDDVRQVFVRKFNTNDIPIIEGRISSGRDLRGAYDFLDLKIKRPLERIAGVGEVRIDGVARRQIDIQLRMDDIKRYRIDVDALFRKLEGVNLNVSLGRIEEASSRFGVLTAGSIDSLDALRRFPVNERGLLLEDIADVDLISPDVTYGRHLNGEFAIGLEIRKSSDANTVETVDKIMAAVEEINQDPALQGIEVLVWHNAGEEITGALSGLLNAGTIGAALAVIVLFLFLRRLGATLAIGLSIPLSIIAAIGFLYLLGNSLNVLSMMGLMLSTGMLVDNAVVVLESIYRHLERGQARLTAALEGTQGVVKAVVASTLTSIIIFVPLVFGKETEVSLFLGHTGIAIMITLICSLFISLTLIPLGLARFFKLKTASADRRREAGGLSRRLLQRYESVLGWTMRHPVWTVLAILGVIIGSVFVPLRDNSIDAQDMENLTIEYELSENYKYSRIEERFIRPVEEYLLGQSDRFGIKNVYSHYANNRAHTRIYFDETKVRIDDVAEIRQEISKGLPVVPGADIRLGQQEGAEERNFLSVNFYGEDPTKLRELVLEAKRRLDARDDFEEIFTGVDESREEVQLVLDRERARRFGVSPESAAGILSIVIRGRQLRSYRAAQGEVEVWISLRPSDRQNIDDLLEIVVGGGPDGEEIRLAQVADLKIAKTAGSIARENQRTYAPMWANFTGDQVDDGKTVIRETLNAMEFVDGYSWSFGFRTVEQESEDQEFAFNLLLALFMVYLVMAALFESFAHPFAIMVSLFFAIPGVRLFLFLTDTPFNLMAMIGTLILVGIVVNNGIVLIDHINNLRRAGMERSRAILEGCRERFRPILMTAATTVVGLLPLALGTSGIFGLRYFPMARTLIGGLIASTVLSLIVLPTVYRLVDSGALWMRRLWFASAPSAKPASTASAKPSPATAG